MPTQIVLFYSGGAADDNRLYYEVAQTNRRNREGWVYNFCMDNFCMDKNCTINQFVGRKKWRFQIGFMGRGAALYTECFLEVVSEMGDDDGF